MVTIQSIRDVLQGLFRTQFDIAAYKFDENFYVEVSEPTLGTIDQMRYPEIIIRVFPNGKKES